MFKVISEDVAKKCKLGSFPVSVISHFALPMSDGEKIALKIFFPSSDLSHTVFANCKTQLIYFPANAKSESKYPAILEYIPYREADRLAERDHKQHVWMASYGFVIIRADLRGSGDSSGVYFGEYLELELKDGIEILEWLAGQAWCNGKTGLYGKSWGGFNGLQIAYLQPPSLAAVIAVYFTHDRYAIDVHYDGGCLMGSEMLSWATYMFALNALPPNPRNISDWKQQWEKRLKEASASWVNKWVAHQTRDDFWKHGSVCEDYDRIKVPVLAIGGWRDSYRDPVFRLLENVKHTRAIFGPWSHDWPNISVPGPNMDYMEECLQWWNYHLKGQKLDSSEFDLPRLRMFIRHSEVPKSRYNCYQGHWIVRHAWPPENIDSVTLALSYDNKLLSHYSARETAISIPYHPASGQSMGEWLTLGSYDAPLDQREEDALSQCFTTEQLAEDFCLLGFAKLNCHIVTRGLKNVPVIARLCDVFPDGTSVLITLGVLNLSHRFGHETDQVRALKDGEVFRCEIELHISGYLIPKGHRLRLALTTNYWPLIWPAATVGQVDMLVGMNSSTSAPFSFLLLPKNTGSISAADVECHKKMVCKDPAVGPILDKKQINLIPAYSNVKKSFSYAEGKYTRIVELQSSPLYYPELGVTMSEAYCYTYEIDNSGPQSAKATCDRYLLNDWPEYDGGTKVEVNVHCVMTGDEEYFFLENTLKVMLNEEVVYESRQDEKVKRFLV